MKWAAGLALGAIGLGVLGGVVLREPLAEMAAESYLHARGFPQAEVSVASIGLERAVIDGVALGPSLPRVARIELSYRPTEILRMRLREVRIEGLRAGFDGWGQQELSRLRSLLPPDEPETGEKEFSPGPKVVVNDFEIVFRDSDRGDMTVSGQGTADLSGPAVGASIDAVARGDFGEASLIVKSENLNGEAAVLDVKGRADIDLVRLPWPEGLDPRPQGGRVAFSLNGTLPMPAPEPGAVREALGREGNLSADITLRQVELPPYAGAVDGTVRLDLETGDGRLRFRIGGSSALAVKALSSDFYRDVERAELTLATPPGDSAGAPIAGSLTAAASLSGGGGNLSVQGEGSWTGAQEGWLPLELEAEVQVRGADADGADIRTAGWHGDVSIGREAIRLAGPFEGRVAVEGAGEMAASGQMVYTARPADLLAGQVAVSDGGLRVPAHDFRAKRIEATLPLAFGTGSEVIRASAIASTISDRIAPVNVEGRLTAEEDVLALDGALAVPEHGLKVPLKATYRRTGTQGRVDIGPAQFEFAPKGLQPRDLGSAFAPVTRADGTVTLEATLEIAAGQIRGGHASLELKGLSLATEQGLVERLDGAVRLDSLFPLSTPGTQTVTARRVVAGVPLEQPVVGFHIETDSGGPVVVVDRGEGRFAGGDVSINGARWRLSAASNEVAVAIRGLSLERLLRDYAMEGMSGTGTLSGRIPIKVSAAGVTIDAGVLEAEDGGVLQVSWGGARDTLLRQGEYVSLMVRALQDFRFKVLRVQVDRPEEGELAAKVTIEGNNPSVKDGYPIRFNITLSGELEEILDAVRQGGRLSSDLFSGALGGYP